MASVASPRKASKSARPFTCAFVSIVVEINDTRYDVDSIPANEFGTRAFRLCKRSGNHEVYDVIRTHEGIVECSCPDYIARHQGNGYGLCKHARALCELGLLAPPIAPEFAPTDNRYPVTVIGAPTQTQIAAAHDEPDAPAPRSNRDPITVSPPAPAPVGFNRDPVTVEPPAPVAACCCGDCRDAAECVEAELEDAGDPSTWPADADAFVWMLTDRHPEPDDGPTDDDAPASDPSTDWFPPADWEPGDDIDDGPAPEDLEPWGREETARDHLDASERLDLAGLIDHQISFYKSWNNAAGDMLAAAMTELAFRVEMTQASTPAELEAREEVLERDARDQMYRVGFDAAMAECRSRGAMTSPIGHPA